MGNLQLIKSEHFGEIEADIYSNGDDTYMTLNQLAGCLEYERKKGVENILSRNEYLKKPENSASGFAMSSKPCAPGEPRLSPSRRTPPLPSAHWQPRLSATRL